MRAVSYLRFSHDKQSKGFSIEEQQQSCKQKATIESDEIVKEFIDRAQSAKSTNRPALAEMISFVCDARNDIDALYIYDISRLSRNQIDFSIIKKQLAQHGVIIKSVNGVPNDTMDGDMLQDILARIAQYENDLRGVKIKGGMYNRFKAGYALHAIRGYKWAINAEGKKVLVPDSTFKIYQSLWNKIRDEKISILQAIKYIKKHFPSSKLTRTSLSRMLQNKAYFGVLEYDKYRGEQSIAKHEPMINEDTYWRVRAIIEGRSHKNIKTRNKFNSDYPLTKSLFCPSCNTRLTAAPSKGKYKSYDYYFCRNRTACKYNKQVSVVHEAFKAELSRLIPSDKTMTLIKEMMREKYESLYNDLSISAKDIERDLRRLQIKQQALLDRLLDGTIEKDIYKQANLRVEAEIMSRKSLQSEKQIDKVDIEAVLEYVTFLFKNIHKIWDRYPIEVKIALQSSTFPKGLYFESGVCRTPEIGRAFKLNEEIAKKLSLSDPNDSYVELLREAMQEYIKLFHNFSKMIPLYAIAPTS